MVVLEVGLGGRLDATNVVTPELCVITPVDFDHEALLGTQPGSHRRGEGGHSRSRACRRSSPGSARRRRAVLERRAAELGIPVTRTEAWHVRGVELGRPRQPFHGSRRARAAHRVPAGRGAPGGERRSPPPWRSTRLGVADRRHRARHRGHPLAGPPGARRPSAPRSSWTAPTTPPAARALAAYIDRFYAGRRVWLIYGAMRDKAIAEMGGMLFPHAAHVVVTAPAQARAARPETIVALASHPDIRPAPDIAAALALVRAAAAPEDAVFVTGSLFLVAEAAALLAGADRT